MRDQVWDALLRDELCNRYLAAMDHAQFLLDIKRDGLPLTLIYYFNSTLQKKR